MSFTEFYRSQRSGREPFPWMHRLADRFASDHLPDVIDLPTGTGKSEVVLIWAWARTQNPALPRRLWMLSDRRVIVDQTHRIAQLLEPAIRAWRLRGGIEADTDPILDPVADQVITATVDQFGSRLLFRGYGSSPRTWPIWAGLAGNDSLVVLDEAHLSPNAEAIFQACKKLGASIRLISMTATPRDSGDVTSFTLDETDLQHPVLGPRLQAKRLLEMRSGGSLEEAAAEFLASGKRRVALICNTVREARRVFEAVQHDPEHKFLLIGRQRPLDRDRIMKDLEPRISSGAAETEPLVVVATQCIEAGADFDFDAMATEACPIDALRQRLGRLDRLGTIGETRCVMLKPPPGREGMPPYGAAPAETWKWLTKHAKKGQIELGLEGWSRIVEFVPDEARASVPETVSLLEPHLRMLARTSPRPRVEPDVDLLLHGPKTAPGAVMLVWRDDVDLDALDDPEERLEATNEILSLVPPSALESCEVPLWEFRKWLSGGTADADAGDVEGARLPEPEDDTGRKVMVWQGREDGVEWISLDRLKPGSLVILRADQGGYDRFGWNPTSTAPVEDVADAAFLARTGRRIERVRRDLDDDAEAIREGFVARPWRGGIVWEEIQTGKGSRLVDLEIPLVDHCERVAAKAKADAEALGLEADILGEAGRHHDIGKAHRDWQLNFNGGSLTKLATPIAKGRFSRSPLSRSPPGWRHEAESLARMQQDAPSLLRWLVATHHGYARPFWPIPDHGVGLAEQMDELHRQHGYWGLALREAVLRCADRFVSANEQAREPTMERHREGA